MENPPLVPLEVLGHPVLKILLPAKLPVAQTLVLPTFTPSVLPCTTLTKPPRALFIVPVKVTVVLPVEQTNAVRHSDPIAHPRLVPKGMPESRALRSIPREVVLGKTLRP